MSTLDIYYNCPTISHIIYNITVNMNGGPGRGECQGALREHKGAVNILVMMIASTL